MNLIAKKITFLVLCFLSFSAFSQNIDNQPGYAVGYSFSNIQYAVISKQGRLFKPELRLFANPKSANDPDFEFLFTYNIVRRKDYSIYIGPGFQFDFARTYLHSMLPVGAIIYPFENKKLGIQMEIAPVASSRMQGSIGIRYRLSDLVNKKHAVNAVHARDTSELYSFNRAFYLTLAGPGLEVGAQYSWFKNNWDWHLGATTIVPFGVYGGVYYHFMHDPRETPFHIYVGGDIGYGLYYQDEFLPIIYLPVGFQYLFKSHFTVALEAATFYSPDEEFVPWFGLKIGKVFVK